MGFLSDLKMYARFAMGLRGFLRYTISLEEAKAIVKKRMEEREMNFLRLIKKGVFGYPNSPYLPLLKLARCELGDIENMVRSRGLEDTLLALREAGVYVTFEEFKGREPIVRDGQHIHVKTQSFDNPYLKHYYGGTSGGTTGPGTRVTTDLAHLADEAPNIILGHYTHHALGIPTVIWYGIPPDNTGLNGILVRAKFGNVPRKWFSPLKSREVRGPLKNLMLTYCFVVLGRLCGTSIPRPKFLSLDQAAVVAYWVAESLQTHGACLVATHVSMALRICIAAFEQGIDLTGAIFWAGGEPPTPSKVQGITRTGACFVPTYFFTEIGAVGLGCAQPADCNDIHLFKDFLALILYPRQLPGTVYTINAFYFTTLLPAAPKLLLNVESDDYGIIEKRSCGCLLESYGFTEHLRHIRSFSKLTGDGVTLLGSEMIHILEEILPARFGGSPLDYQLLEEEDEKGFTHLSLLVSPKVKIDDEAEVFKTVLESLGHGSDAADLARNIWTQSMALQIKRIEPIWTARGKLMPLQLAKRFKNSD